MVHKVKMIIADADQTAAHADDILDGIPPYYAEQYRKMNAKQEAGQELTAGFLLKHYLGVRDDGQLIRTEYGKPVLRSGEGYFNLSHSGSYVALGIGDMDLGVDMERIMDVHWPTVKKVFSREQQGRLKRTPEREQPVLFTRMWTGCEAALKLIGTGFGVEIQEKSGLAKPFIHWFRYRDYIIACAAGEEFELWVETGIGTAGWWQDSGGDRFEKGRFEIDRFAKSRFEKEKNRGNEG